METSATSPNRKNDNIECNDKSMFADLAKITRIWCLLSSSNGLPNMMRSPNFAIQVFWAIGIITVVSYCSYLTILLFMNYYENQKTISSQLMFESPTYFPAVDICNLSPYGNEKALKLISENLFANYSNSLNIENYISVADNYNYLILAMFQDLNFKGIINISDYITSIEDMLISCKFQGKECSASDFIPIENFYYGNCFRFNGGSDKYKNSVQIKQSTQSGPQYGLQLEIDAGDPKFSQYFSYTRGIRVIVHNQSDIAIFPEEDGIFVSTGLYTDISVTRTFLYQLNEPYNYCLDYFNDSSIENNDLLNLMNQRFGKNGYNQKYCLKLCMQRYINDYCHCTDFSLPIFVTNTINNTYCVNQNQIDCTNQAKGIFFNSTANINCQILCPLDCSINIVDTSISLANYPSTWYFENLYNNNSNNSSQTTEFTDRYLIFNVFYKDFSYTEITESPVNTLATFIAALGGAFNLCMGVSFMSLVEILELFFHFIRYFNTKNYQTFLNDLYNLNKYAK